MNFLRPTLQAPQDRYDAVWYDDAGYAWNPNNPRPAVLETMGVLGSNIHTPAEYAELDSIVPRLYLSVRMIQTLCESR